MDILIRLAGVHSIREVVLPDGLERGNHRLEVLSFEVPSSSQGARVRDGGIEVVGHQAPVKVSGLTEPLHRVVRARGEAAAPQGALFRLTSHDPLYFPWFRFAEILLGSDHSSMKPLA